jgi:hypothetical protein
MEKKNVYHYNRAVGTFDLVLDALTAFRHIKQLSDKE